MKQKDEFSTLIAGVVSEVVTGVVTGVTASRRRYYRKLLIVAIVVAVITFAISVMLWNYVPNAQDDISAPAPARGQRPE
jgi:hypothetical protein